MQIIFIEVRYLLYHRRRSPMWHIVSVWIYISNDYLKCVVDITFFNTTRCFIFYLSDSYCLLLWIRIVLWIHGYTCTYCVYLFIHYSTHIYFKLLAAYEMHQNIQKWWKFLKIVFVLTLHLIRDNFWMQIVIEKCMCRPR